jgi:hypothetical protein
LQPEQTVSELANEVLTRQAKARAERSGEPIEEAMEAVLETETPVSNSGTSGTVPTAKKPSNRRRWAWRGSEPGSG